MTKVRVVCVFNAFDVENAGGIQVSAREAWQAIAQDARFDARALLVTLEGERRPYDDPGLFVTAGRLQTAVAALRRNWHADIALFWHLDLLKLAPAMRMGNDCKRVVFLHGTEAWRSRGALTRREMRRLAAVFCNSTFTISKALLANPELMGVPSTVVQLGVEEVVAPARPDEVPIAIMISRLDSAERYKGHEEVIAAWPEVLKRIPGAQLWIVGDGDLTDDLQAQAAASDSSDAIRFFGRITDEQKQALLRRARCLLMPSVGEGFGLVYLEAMRLGRPCLVGLDGGHSIINPPEAGYSVTHRTPQEISDAVTRLLTLDEAWHRQSEAARARYAARYTAGAFRARLVEALIETVT